MSLDHEAIRKEYHSVVIVDDSKGAFDASGNSVSLSQSDIDAARTTLNTEAAAVKYKTDRMGTPFTGISTTVYAGWREQMAMLYDDILAGKVDSTGSFAIHNKAVKDAHPKP